MKERLRAIWRRDVRRRIIAVSLDASCLLARAGLMSRARGHGAIFTLHHVRPKQTKPLEPNVHLEITPEFLSQAIETLAAAGYDFIALDEIPARLKSPTSRPFAAFTLDDGYRNNAEHAAPVFTRHNVPFTVFITRGFAERSHSLWWETLGELLGRIDALTFDFGNGPETLDLTSTTLKFDAFDRFCHYVGSIDEAFAVANIDALARRHGLDPLQLTADLVMDPQELRTLLENPLASLGAHTLSHRAVSRLSPDDAATEMRQSADWLETLTGRRPVTIAYPYGSEEAVSPRDCAIAEKLGFAVAVTTQPGTLGERHLDRMTGLPRISLNGYFQQPRFVTALASGIPFARGK